MSRAWVSTFGVVTLLALIHVGATWTNGWMLPSLWREAVGASAATLFTRPFAQFTAPFFHESPGHLVYNVVVLLLALPIALRAFGVVHGLLVLYLASPVGSMLVDLFAVLPLASLSAGYAVEAASVKLVGASVVAFAAAGAALAALARQHGRSPMFVAFAVVGVLAYEGVLAALEITRPFVFAYHLSGFAIGLAWGLSSKRLNEAARWRHSRAGQARHGSRS